MWICDTCDRLIEDAKEGMVEWLVADDQSHAKDLRLVHGSRACQYHSKEEPNYTLNDMHLSALQGPEGLISFISMHEKKIPELEVVSMLRRVCSFNVNL